MKKNKICLAGITMLAGIINVNAEVTIPNEFTANSPAVASEVNDNFTAVADGVNANEARIVAVEAVTNATGNAGSSTGNPADNCNALLQSQPGIASGIYWLKSANAKSSFRAYCDMTTEGGGWTLVWSNLRGGSGKVVTKIAWGAAINTLPRFRGEPGSDLESFEVYTGLAHWNDLAPDGELRYAWSSDYGQPIDQHYTVPFTLDSAAEYTITFNQTSGLGTSVPGLVSGHNGAKFSTHDVDNDTAATSQCARTYSDTPWWYNACWSGNINGGGEWGGTQSSGGGWYNGNSALVAPPTSHHNGAYWTGSSAQWGTSAGVGAGNGWIFIR